MNMEESMQYPLALKVLQGWLSQKGIFFGKIDVG